MLNSVGHKIIFELQRKNKKKCYVYYYLEYLDHQYNNGNTRHLVRK